ncbi:MAG: hypothetical protein QOK08_1825 [Actinomycetota bacterium]|nr:hypothetical protein [Glaciihabitans sp.]MDQ1544187.1 hypothetical protein [Actinomycetota bacterium]MDQ1560727.1 hypothetical protein [Actinomycetota bacterium]
MRASLLGALIGATLVAPIALVGCSSTAPPEPKYGGMPSYLPKAAVKSDSVLTGSMAKPALTTEGDSVRVVLAGGTALATVTGPEVPGEGLPYQTRATTATWTVTLTDATTDVPISVADFTSIDHLGAVYHPQFVAGQPKPPTELKPGESVTFELRAVMAVGEGLMRWAPDGTHILGSWDFEVEND